MKTQSGLPSVLWVHQLTKRFGNLTAVDDFDLKLSEGEIVALVGPNGAGKTTLIKMITGLIIPDQGKVTVGGFDVWGDGVKAKRLIGYVPDEPETNEYLSGREFLELAGDLHGLRRDRTTERIETLLPIYDLKSIIDQPFADYSRGSKQKVVMLAAMIHHPKLVIIDEPMVGLDTQSQKTTIDWLKRIAKDGASVLICSHTLPLMQQLASRFGIINQGKLLALGSLKELCLKAKAKHHDLEEIYLKLTKLTKSTQSKI